MTLDGICRISERRCWRLNFNQDPCGDDLSIEEAGACIRLLEKEVASLMEELAAADRLIERLKAEAGGFSTQGTAE